MNKIVLWFLIKLKTNREKQLLLETGILIKRNLNGMLHSNGWYNGYLKIMGKRYMSKIGSVIIHD